MAVQKTEFKRWTWFFTGRTAEDQRDRDTTNTST